MKIAAVSDVHGLWCGLDYPEADLLVFSGDIFDYYDRNQRRNAEAQLEELKMFNDFLETIKDRYQEIICIAGNHGFVFIHHHEEARMALTNTIYLQDESIEFMGQKIYGSPWQKYFGGWGFNFPDHNANFFRARAHAKKCWNAIPKDTNILITHTPALGILDETARGVEAGCRYLGERIFYLKELSLHLFGHIHAAHGWKKINHRPLQKKSILHINASNCYTHNKLKRPITLIELTGGVARVV
jgi:Icc-related predicted phosphoesterase